MKTADELGITQSEFDALLWVKDNLENERFVKRFDMSFSNWATDCGTTYCIGGWVAVKMSGKAPNEEGEYDVNWDGVDSYVYSHSWNNKEKPPRHLIDRLYYPIDADLDDWEDITQHQGAEAIGNFLNTGNPEWRSVMGDV